MLNGQDVPVSLNRAIAPCGVNSFLSLASQGFYDNTTCHRLTVSEQLNILQCGDPTGKGNGGPGYSFATEVATDATYPVGTVALANAGRGHQRLAVLHRLRHHHPVPPSTRSSAPSPATA